MRIPIIAISLAAAVGAAACGPTPAASPTSLPTKPAATTVASTAAQVAAALTPVPGSASPAGQGGSVANGPKQYPKAPEMAIDPKKSYSASIETNLGSMTAELYPGDAPLTVNNFVFLARDGYYNGVTFHRVIKDFMAQTGDPTGTGTGGPGYRFPDEKVTRKYVRGTLAMANAGPNTNGSQFFIVHKDYQLPPSYTIFGQVTTGLDTLDKIAEAPNGQGRGGANTPKTEIQITSITITEK